MLVLFGVTILLNGGVNSAHADDVVDHVKVTVPSSCSFSEVQTPDNSEYSVIIHTGEYKPEIGSTTFRVYCNDTNGYSVYAIGYSNNEYGNTEMVHNSDSAFNFQTGIATSGSASNWAMKLTPVFGTYAPTIQSDVDGSYLDYHVVPSAYTKVATFPSITDSPTEQEEQGSAFQSNYAIWVAAGQATGTYTGKVRYALVHPANESAPPEPQPSTAGCINYFANTTSAEGTMGCQSANDGESIDLLASNFSREGYGFAGWSNKYDYATNTDPDLKFYGPQETITVPEGTTANGLSLYAVWVKSVGSLQDGNKVAELCGTTTTNGTLVQAPAYGTGTANLSSVSALTDQRDNQTYAIAKLADGKCWMIENLRLEAEDSRGNNRFDPSITNESLAQGYDASFIGLADPELNNFTTTNANSLYTTEIDVIGKIAISGSNQASRFPRYNNNNTNQRAENTTKTNMNTYSYGNYYTWHAAIADTTDYTGGDHNVTSICPTGWRIPTGNVSGDYNTLNINANTGSTSGSAGLRAYPTNFLYSGFFYGSSAYSKGSYGYYWSSSAADNVDYYSYCLGLSSSNSRPMTDSNKGAGHSIRCMAQSQCLFAQPTFAV